MSYQDVHEEQLVALHGGTTPVRSRWTYRASQPYAVAVAFQSGPDRWVEWVFARELLDTGLGERAGIGDVQVWPERTLNRSALVLQIESPEGRATIELELRAVAAFLDATAQLVPLGAEEEYFDIDALIDEITQV